MDDHEELDWGNDDDETQTSVRVPPNDDIAQADDDDAEDAVSLGGDDEEDANGYLTYQQPPETEAVADDTQKSTDRSRVAPTRTPSEESLSDKQQQQGKHQKNLQRPSSRQSAGRKVRRGSSSQSVKPANSSTSQASPQRPIIHALPPKPVGASVVPFVHHSDPSLTEATAMVQRRERELREKNKAANNLSSSIKFAQGSVVDSPTLPPDWEIRHSRSGEQVYYYNVRTHESQWKPPLLDSPSAQAPERKISDNNARERRRSSVTSISTPLTSQLSSEQASQESTPAYTYQRPSDPVQLLSGALTSSASQGPLSYEDRHYRPGGDSDDPFSTNSGSTIIPPRESRVSEEHSRYVDSERDVPVRSRQSVVSPRSVSPPASHIRPRDRDQASHANIAQERPSFHSDLKGDTWIAPNSRDGIDRPKQSSGIGQDGRLYSSQHAEAQRNLQRTDNERLAPRMTQASGAGRPRNDAFPNSREFEPLEHVPTPVASSGRRSNDRPRERKQQHRDDIEQQLRSQYAPAPSSSTSSAGALPRTESPPFQTMPQTQNAKRERLSRFDKPVQHESTLPPSSQSSPQVLSPHAPPIFPNLSLPPFPPQFPPRHPTQSSNQNQIQPSADRQPAPESKGPLSRRDTYIPSDIKIVATLPPEHPPFEGEPRETRGEPERDRRGDERGGRAEPSRERRPEHMQWNEHADDRHIQDDSAVSSVFNRVSNNGDIDRVSRQVYPPDNRERDRERDIPLRDRDRDQERGRETLPGRRQGPHPSMVDVRPSEPLQPSVRKREPLPPQSAHYRSNKAKVAPNSDPQFPSSGPTPPSGPREPSNRYSQLNSAAPPSGPRYHGSQSSAAVEHSRGRRGGPSASTGERRGDNERYDFIEPDKMDVDEPLRNPASRTQGSESLPQRPSYPDLPSADLPKGPRAMIGKNTPQPGPRLSGPVTSPVLPAYVPQQPGSSGPQRQPRERERERERSPPPHMMPRGDRDREHEAGWKRAGGGAGSNGAEQGGRYGDEVPSSWRNEDLPARPVESPRNQGRREPRQWGRPSRGQAPLSGGNEVPVAPQRLYQRTSEALSTDQPQDNSKREPIYDHSNGPYSKMPPDDAGYRPMAGREDAHDSQRQYGDIRRPEPVETNSGPSPFRRDVHYPEDPAPHGHPVAHQRPPPDRSWSVAPSPELRGNPQREPTSISSSLSRDPSTSPVFDNDRAPPVDGQHRRPRKSRFDTPRLGDNSSAWPDNHPESGQPREQPPGDLHGPESRRPPELQMRLGDRQSGRPDPAFQHAGLPPKPTRHFDAEGDMQPERRPERPNGPSRHNSMRDQRGPNLEWEDNRRPPAQLRGYPDTFPDHPQTRAAQPPRSQPDGFGYAGPPAEWRSSYPERRDTAGPPPEKSSAPPRAGSLLDRISMSGPDSRQFVENGLNTAERVDLPMKRDRDASEMHGYERYPTNTTEDYEDGGENKRRRRGPKGRRGGGNGRRGLA